MQARIKEKLKLRVIGLCEGNSLLTGEFPSQRVSNAENVYIWWRHHEKNYASRRSLSSITPKERLFYKLRSEQNGCHFPDDISKWVFLNENGSISIKISLRFVPRGWVNNILAMVQIMAWHRPGDKPSSEPTMVNLLTHICVTRPQWVNSIKYKV